MQSGQELRGTPIATIRILREASQQRFGQQRRNFRPTIADILWRFQYVRGQQPLSRRGIEHRASGEHLIGEDTYRVDVSTVVDVRLRGRLFRRHVMRGSDRNAHRGEFVGR